MLTKTTDKINDLTLQLNEVEQLGIKKIIEGVEVNAKFAKIPRMDGDLCRMHVQLKVNNLNPECSLFVRDAFANDPKKIFEVDSVGADSSVVQVSFIRNLSENYIDNQDLQESATKNIFFQLQRVFDRELSALKKVVHGHELYGDQVFSKTKSKSAQTGFFARINDMLGRKSEKTGFNF